jgi:hypothetical protein
MTNLSAILTPSGLATSAQGTKADLAVASDTSLVAGSDQIANMVSLTQAEYDALTPNATTVYVIVG